MKSNRPFVFALVASLVAVAASAQAQDQVTHLAGSNGADVTLTSGQPHPDHYGPPPAFSQLDVNHDGSVSRQEAEAYPPLFNDFDYLAHHSDRISKRQFDNWAQTQGR